MVFVSRSFLVLAMLQSAPTALGIRHEVEEIRANIFIQRFKALFISSTF